MQHTHQRTIGWSIFVASVLASAWAGLATARLQPPDAQTKPPEYIGCFPKPADWDLQVKQVAELRRGATALDLPQGISAEVHVERTNVSWTVSIGTNERGPARLIDLAKAVGMDAHDRSRVLVAWSDHIAAKLREFTIETMRRVRPDLVFYPETGLSITVDGHPFPRSQRNDEPARKSSTRFLRSYYGSDCVRYLNGELKIDQTSPRSPAVGSVAAKVTFDSPAWNLSAMHEGVITFTNTTPNRVRIAYTSVVMSKNGVEVPFLKNGARSGLPDNTWVANLVIEPGETSQRPMGLVTSTPFGRYDVSAGELVVKITSTCDAGVRVEPVVTKVIAMGKAPAAE